MIKTLAFKLYNKFTKKCKYCNSKKELSLSEHHIDTLLCNRCNSITKTRLMMLEAKDNLDSEYIPKAFRHNAEQRLWFAQTCGTDITKKGKFITRSAKTFSLN